MQTRTVERQGVVVLAFVHNPANLAKLKAALDTPGRLYEPTAAQLEEWCEQRNRQTDEFYNIRHISLASSTPNISLQKPEPLYPSISRDTGAKILHLVAIATEPVPIVKEKGFIADTLFCEWSYVLDLDEEMLEVYGGNRDGQAQKRFGEGEGVKAGEEPNLVGRWKLDALPESQFLQTGARAEDDGE